MSGARPGVCLSSEWSLHGLFLFTAIPGSLRGSPTAIHPGPAFHPYSCRHADAQGTEDKRAFWPLRGVSFSVDTSKSFHWYPGAWSRQPCCALPAEDMDPQRHTGQQSACSLMLAASLHLHLRKAKVCKWGISSSGLCGRGG